MRYSMYSIRLLRFTTIPYTIPYCTTAYDCVCARAHSLVLLRPLRFIASIHQTRITFNRSKTHTLLALLLLITSAILCAWYAHETERDRGFSLHSIRQFNSIISVNWENSSVPFTASMKWTHFSFEIRPFFDRLKRNWKFSFYFLIYSSLDSLVLLWLFKMKQKKNKRLILTESTKFWMCLKVTKKYLFEMKLIDKRKHWIAEYFCERLFLPKPIQFFRTNYRKSGFSTWFSTAYIDPLNLNFYCRS